MPKVSVIMPAYNAATYLKEAAASILAQTFTDFELLLINDGSTDNTPALVDQLAASDPRIHPIHQSNQRIVATLNKGITLARGEFIAIMHADDIALPTRFQKQLAHFQQHPDIAVCGTWIETFSATGTGRVWQYPTDPDFIACFLLFWCCLAHPTVMMRREIFDQGGLAYDPAYNHAAEDYGLWAAASARYKIGNVPEVLLRYREHSGQGSQVFKVQQRAETRAIRCGLLSRLGISANEEEMDLHQQLAESELVAEEGFLRRAEAWLRRIREGNEKSAAMSREVLEKVLGGRWAAVCLHAKNIPGIWELFWASPLSQYVDLGLEKNRLIPIRPA